MSTFDHEIGEFHGVEVRRVEQGPVKAVLRTVATFGQSRLVQEYTLYQDTPRLDVRVVVDWHEQLKLLKLRFPVQVDAATATYEIPYGAIERSMNGEEEPGQSWLDITGVLPGTRETFGVSLINDAKYSFDVRGNGDIGLTVVRSPVFAHHDPYLLRESEDYCFMDQGQQEFHYALWPHCGRWEQAGTIEQARMVNQAPFALWETYHDGPLPQKGSYVAVQGEGIVVSTVKVAQDGDALILRCYETAHRVTQGTLSLPQWGRKMPLTLGPAEIKTWRVPKNLALPVHEVDLLELEVEEE